MRLYETAFLIAPNLPEEETEQFITEMAEVVSSRKGKMVNLDKWGKRKLAYPIQKFEAAFYVFFLYEGGPDIPGELERRLKQMETVIRYLTVKKDVRDNVRRKRGFPRRKEPEMAREPAPRAAVKKEEEPKEIVITPVVKEKGPTDIIEPEKEEKKKETKPKEEDKIEEKEKKEDKITEAEKPKKEEEKAKEEKKPKKEEKAKEAEKAKEEKKPKQEEKVQEEAKDKKEAKPKKEEKIKEKEAAKEEKTAKEKVKETEKKKEKDKEEKS